MSTLEARAPLLMGLAVVVYAIAFTAAAWIKLSHLQMGYDLAFYQQAIWNTTQGRFFEVSGADYTTSFFGVEVMLFALAIVPFYALAPGPQSMLLFQAVLIALGALPVYWLTVRVLKNRLAGLALALSYLLYPAVEYSTLYEVRFHALAMALLLFALYFYERGAWKSFLLFALLAASCRSDVALGVAMIGLYGLTRRRPWPAVAAPLALGGLWFMLGVFVVVPHLNTTGRFTFLTHYSAFGSSAGEIVLNVLTKPGLVAAHALTAVKLRYLLLLVLPLGLLPLASPLALIPALPAVAANLLSERPAQFDLYHHYQGVVIPFLYLATILSLAWIGGTRGGTWPTAIAPWRRLAARLGVPLVLLCTLGSNLALGNAAAPYLLHPAPPARFGDVQSLIARIPPEAGVAAANRLTPLVPPRRVLFFASANPLYSMHPYDTVDYVLLDRRDREAYAEARAALALAEWEETASAGDFVLLQRRAGGAAGATPSSPREDRHS